MNIHLSQSIPAIAETKNIISTVENFNSSQDSKPMIGFKLDVMTSAYLITLGSIRIPKWLFNDILSKLDSERVKHKLNHIKEVLSWKTDISNIFNQLIQTNPELQSIENKLSSLQQEYDLAQEKYKTAKGKDIASMYKQIEKMKTTLQTLQRQKHTILDMYQSSMLEEIIYTGHNLISVLLPDDFEYEIQNNASPDKKPVLIVRGVLLSGTLDKKAMGSSSGSLIHHLSKDYNNQRAVRFVSEFSRMMNGWMYQQGFTVGIYDCIAHNTEVIEEEINKNLLKAKASIQSEKDPELREMNIKIALNDTASIARKIAAEALKPDNNIKKIVKSGSKGNDFNITQITGLVGQQNVSGNRIEKQFGGRTLPHFEFEIDDIRTEFMSRGFVFSSYFKGMNPMETFFAAAGGREGLIDTAVKSVTGDTSIIVLQHGNILQTTIGEWIDGQLDNPNVTDKIQHFKEMNMEYLEIEEQKTYIPTCDAKGKTSWGEVVAITRHDPGNELFEIKTQSGREVIVTASKSLVIWNEEKEEFLPTLMKDVKVGDYVPVTMELCEPPVVKTYVDMSTYLPKTEYVYGTDFNMAVEAMNNEMDGKSRVSKGWWEDNNGKTFTVPYPSKAILQRVMVRSNVADIKFGYVYPFSGERHDNLIPDKFQLNYENGIFIGLFLADGNVDIHRKAEVRITKNNKKVQEFVTKWFDKHKIHYFIEKKVVEKTETRPGGTSTMIRGNCSVLAQFLLKFVGHTSYDKFIPNEAFTAPIEFIRGLVSGFFSGDGSIDTNGYCIESCSTSKKLIDGIIYCLNRLGIFSKLTKRERNEENFSTIYRLSIRSQWALLFKHQIELIEDDKQARLDALDPTEEHRNYPFINNVVYDSIVEINKVSVEKYPKVYDLTIPSTFNFSISSGLICRDTADTGYLSRRMEKILEDLTASYIGTVNDASHNIVQFNYGEDNFDAGKCIHIGSKGGKQIYSFIDLKHVVTKYNTGLEWKQRKTGVVNKKRKLTQEEIHKIKEDIIRETYKAFFHKNTTNEVVNNSFSTLEPTIYQIEVYPEVIQDIYKEISRQLKLAIVNPGESVGHIAASSMGEKNTQLTLNSVVGKTSILVLINNKAIQTTIGELIHSIGNNKGFTTVKYEGQNDTIKEATAEIVDVSELDWKIQSVDENGQVDWRQITKCIRHPLYTDVIKVKTESGRDVIATTGLSFLIKDKTTGKIVPIKGSDLKVGDRIPIGYKSPRVINTVLNLRDVICPTEYIFGSELWKAREYRDKYSSKELVAPKDFKKDGKNAKWWTIHQYNDFILPFTRSDHAMRTLEGYNSINRGNEFYKRGCVYIKCQTISEAHIPESIELDELFGFFVGIYLAEGCCSENYISISNYDINVLNKVQLLCEKWNIGWHHVKIGYKYKHMNKYELLNGRTVSDACEIRIHSKLITTIMEKTCGRGSENKHIPDFAYTAPDTFIKGMLDALYSGDGTIHSNSIDYISISERLIDGLITILSSIGITGSKRTYLPKSNNKNSKYIQRVYSVNILQRNNKRFSDFVNVLTVKHKSDKIQHFKTKKYTHNVYWSKQAKIREEYLYVNDSEDVFMDSIVSIEKVDTTTIEYVYDFEVPSTGNFNILNQMHVRDSFHSSGQLKKNLTYGVVRLQELMNATHNPKTRSLTIYFNKLKVDVTNLATIRQLANMFLLSRTLANFITSYKIEKHPELTKQEQIWYYAYKTFVANDDTSSCSYRLRLHINTDLLFLTKRTLRQICKQIEMILIKNVSFYVICSPDATGIIDIWIEDNISEPSTFFTVKGMEDDLLLDNFINRNNKMNHLIKKIILPKLQKCHISGIEGITECYYDQTNQEEWFIQTRGGSLKCLFFNTLFDHERSSTNDMWEVYELFGVESAKKWLKEEFSQMLDVNHRHLDVLVDKVTFNGSISSVNIYGLDRKIIGPLSKAVFERPLASLLTAAQKAELDRLSSIGACIATGKVGRFGTGMVDVILDNQAVITNEYAKKTYIAETSDTYELSPLAEEEEGLTVEEAIDLNEEDIY